MSLNAVFERPPSKAEQKARHQPSSLPCFKNVSVPFAFIRGQKQLSARLFAYKVQRVKPDCAQSEFECNEAISGFVDFILFFVFLFFYKVFFSPSQLTPFSSCWRF